jgi:hypothetical protein
MIIPRSSARAPGKGLRMSLRFERDLKSKPSCMKLCSCTPVEDAIDVSTAHYSINH